MSIFSGIWIPLVTPFRSGEIDHEALRRLVRSYRADGVAGFVALGTTGEPSSLRHDEKKAVLDTVLDEANGCPVVVGLAGNNVAELHAQSHELNTLPLSGILVPAPYYVRPSQAGLLGHFTSLADISAHPVVLYDIPYRTGVTIEVDTLLTLAAHPNITAVKDCGGSLQKTLALILDGRLSVLAGEDLGFFNLLCLGGSGAIAASAHLRTDAFVGVYRAVKNGDLAEGRRLFHRLVPLIEALGAEPNPGPVKQALANLGQASNELRAPMTGVSAALRARLEAILGGNRGAGTDTEGK